jgi:hypothetical protein
MHHAPYQCQYCGQQQGHAETCVFHHRNPHGNITPWIAPELSPQSPTSNEPTTAEQLGWVEKEVAPQATGGAVKHDAEKDQRPELIQHEFITELARVASYGATRYGDRNFLKGMAWSRWLGAALRHIYAWAGGEKVDKESGLHHLAHAAYSLHALVVYEARGIEKDDR